MDVDHRVHQGNAFAMYRSTGNGGSLSCAFHLSEVTSAAIRVLHEEPHLHEEGENEHCVHGQTYFELQNIQRMEHLRNFSDDFHEEPDVCEQESCGSSVSTASFTPCQSLRSLQDQRQLTRSRSTIQLSSRGWNLHFGCVDLLYR
eukprot:543680-Pleurochrysis_carterae.AAC.1